MEVVSAMTGNQSALGCDELTQNPLNFNLIRIPQEGVS